MGRHAAPARAHAPGHRRDSDFHGWRRADRAHCAAFRCANGHDIAHDCRGWAFSDGRTGGRRMAPVSICVAVRIRQSSRSLACRPECLSACCDECGRGANAGGFRRCRCRRRPGWQHGTRRERRGGAVQRCTESAVAPAARSRCVSLSGCRPGAFRCMDGPTRHARARADRRCDGGGAGRISLFRRSRLDLASWRCRSGDCIRSGSRRRFRSDRTWRTGRHHAR